MLLLSLLLPLLLILALLPRQPWAVCLYPLMPLPALWLVIFPEQWRLPMVLTGLQLGVDTLGRPLLLLATLLWLAAGLYARAYLPGTEQRRFGVFWALTWVGTLGTLVALDAVSFYLFFTWMSLAAYGLIVHTGSDSARQAGRIYLIMAMLGEALILPALLLLVGPGGDTALTGLPARLAVHPWQPLIIGLLLGGFGIKLGILPLHVWLPLAHPAAPTPASAVLSGVLIKLGLLGWLRLLPLGELALPGWASLCMALGLGGALYGVLAGLGQQHPKTVLAYSSISQMGLVISLVGIAMNAPGAWPQIALMITIFSLHHGLAKGALFLGQGVLSRGADWTALALLLPALALAGAPLTSGALAKSLYKTVTPLAPGAWPGLLTPLLTVSSAATSLLLIRFVSLSWPRQHQPQPVPVALWMPWLALVVLGIWLPWYWAASWLPGLVAGAVSSTALWGALLPLLAGTLLAWPAHRLGWPPHLPEGDLLALGRYRPRLVVHQPFQLPTIPGPSAQRLAHGLAGLLGIAERRLRRWSVAGLFVLLTGLLLWLVSNPGLS